MFLNNVLHVEVLSIGLCQKVEKWAESLRKKSDENVQQLLQERREILDCEIRLLQSIDKNSTSTEQILTELKGISFKEHLGKIGKLIEVQLCS